MWSHRGQARPKFAEAPGAGQESVWDYPRPPALVACRQTVEVRAGDALIAASNRCMRVLETASPPSYYIPPAEIDMTRLAKAPGSSYCEWKGVAQYWALAGEFVELPVGWSYPHPPVDFAALKDWLSFYPARVDCWVAGEKVRPQPGGFYGGWITSEITGPFKGDPGTLHW
jgi:uncharacterized protein (DUF427 family)